MCAASARKEFQVLGSKNNFRAYGTFEQPNPFGGYMGLVWPLAASIARGLCCNEKVRRRESEKVTSPLLPFSLSPFLLLGIARTSRHGALPGCAGSKRLARRAGRRRRCLCRDGAGACEASGDVAVYSLRWQHFCCSPSIWWMSFPPACAIKSPRWSKTMARSMFAMRTLRRSLSRPSNGWRIGRLPSA